jgi:hypothetical protein
LLIFLFLLKIDFVIALNVINFFFSIVVVVKIVGAVRFIHVVTVIMGITLAKVHMLLSKKQF